jgi:hypothetical protein
MGRNFFESGKGSEEAATLGSLECTTETKWQNRLPKRHKSHHKDTSNFRKKKRTTMHAGGCSIPLPTKETNRPLHGGSTRINDSTLSVVVHLQTSRYPVKSSVCLATRVIFEPFAQRFSFRLLGNIHCNIIWDGLTGARAGIHLVDLSRNGTWVGTTFVTIIRRTHGIPIGQRSKSSQRPCYHTS